MRHMTALSDSGTAVRGKRLSWLDALGLAVAGAVLIIFRLHAFDLPLETDECNYAYIGGRLLAGDRLYVDVWDHQPFGVFALFAGVISVFGDAPDVFRWLATAFSLGSLVLIYAMVHQCAGRGAALTSAVLFAFASSDPGTAGEGCNREIYMNTFILAAWYLAVRGGGTRSWMLSASGVALGIGSTLKTILAVHWVFLALWIAVAAARGTTPRARFRSVVTSLVWFAAGPAIIWLGALVYFTVTQRFEEFTDAVFLFNLSYSGSSEHFVTRLIRFFSPPRHPFLFESALPLWIGLIGTMAWLLVDAIRHKSRQSLAILSLVAGGYLAVCLPGRFWPHYYYLLVPPGVIAVSVVLAKVTKHLSAYAPSNSRMLRWAVPAVYAVFPAWLFITEHDGYMRQPSFGITVNRYNSRDFWGRAIGEKIRSVTASDDTIFVYGNEAEIYYYARRRCATRFTMITGIQSAYAGAESRRKTLMADLRRARPRVLIVLFDEDAFEEWGLFQREHYGVAVGWDCHDRYTEFCTDPRREYVIMLVYVDRDRPVEPIEWSWDRREVGGWFPTSKR